MKTYFINLFNYDRYANELIFETILKAGKPVKPVQLMAHVLAAQQVWLTRCLGLPPIDISLWPDLNGNTDTFGEKIANNALDWINYLGGLDHSNFNKAIAYQNTKGQGFETKLADILAHLINHGTHHRAQIGQLIKQPDGRDLPNTDYILYVRNFN